MVVVVVVVEFIYCDSQLSSPYKYVDSEQSKRIIKS